MVVGKRNKQMSFSDNWLEERISEDDFHYQLRVWAKNNLDENDFEPLFLKYGWPSILPHSYFFRYAGKIRR